MNLAARNLLQELKKAPTADWQGHTYYFCSRGCQAESLGRSAPYQAEEVKPA